MILEGKRKMFSAKVYRREMRLNHKKNGGLKANPPLKIYEVNHQF